MAGERDSDVGCGGGFSDATLAGGDYDNPRGGSGELGFATVLEN